MRVLSERLVGNYKIVATEKEAEKLPLNELQEWPENLWRRVAEAEAALHAEKVAHGKVAEEAIFIHISISKSASLTIELQMLTDGAASKTAAKNQKSSTTVIEVGGEMRMKMAHADAASMTKCSEVESRAKRITHDADWRADIERGRRIFERIRVRTDKVARISFVLYRRPQR
jgi:hypothetical protein